LFETKHLNDSSRLDYVMPLCDTVAQPRVRVAHVYCQQLLLPKNDSHRLVSNSTVSSLQRSKHHNKPY